MSCPAETRVDGTSLELATPSTKSIDHYPDTLIAHGQWSELRYRSRGICRERKTGGQQQGTFKTSRSEYGDSGEPIQESPIAKY